MSPNLARNIQPTDLLKDGFHKRPNLVRKSDIAAITQTLTDNESWNKLYESSGGYLPLITASTATMRASRTLSAIRFLSALARAISPAFTACAARAQFSRYSVCG